MATPEQALEKLKYFCAYQDRCHREVEKKLHQLKVWGDDAAEVISTLIQEGYLNEERYACSFARGKFRMNQWGRNKILQSLRFNNISAYCIKKAMQEIDEEEYAKTLYRLAEKKYEHLKKEQHLRRKHKTTQYLIGKGYEPELVYQAVKSVIAGK